jgi:hypothetical protein
MLILAAFGNRFSVRAQQTRFQSSAKAEHLVSKESRPDLAIEWQKVAKVKIVTRKEGYRVGEMINIDIAVINESESPVFFRPIDAPKLLVRDHAGRSVTTVPYVVRELSWTPSLFELVSQDEFLTHSFSLLAGCDTRAFEQINSTSNSRELFDKNLFLNWGDSCLQIADPGTYFITAEFVNKMVRTSAKSAFRTAVGSLKSEPLKITIVG